MLKKCFFSILWTMLVAAGVSAAATMTPVTPSKDGNCYQIGTAAELYGFAAIVNGTNGHEAEPAACGVLTADIVVNEHVLKNASGQSCVNTTTGPGSFNANGCNQPEYLSTLYTWTPIGTYSSKPFQGTFDGLGHTISGLFDNNTSSAAKYTGLFGYVSGTNATVSIKNVGVEDSYFRVTSYAGGIVGLVHNGSGVLNIENVYNASTFYIKGSGLVGGLIGYVGANWTLNITNAYNSGSIFGTSGKTTTDYVAGLVGYITTSSTSVNIKNTFNNGNLNGYAPLVNSNASVQNSYYLGDAAQGSYGVNKSASDFSNGSVFAALRSAEGGSVWHQYQGDSYPSFAEKEGKTPFVPHSATLHYSSTESETIYFVEGSTASLPTVDKSGNPVLGWYDNEGLTGTKYTEIPASANSDLSLYPKVMKLVGGCYEISDADMLYAFAAAVNNGNAIACGKLTANIVVNQNVLTTADGTSNVSSSGEYIGSNSASFRQWTPIGDSYNRPFKGTFDGQGHTISGLYFNDPSSSDVGLFSSVFGDPKPVTIENVGLVDSYFRGNSSVGGLVGNAKGLVTIKNSFNAGSINAQGGIFGGLVGYSLQSSADDVKLTISNSYNTGSLNGGSYGGGLVGSAVDLIISNSYNTGSVTVSKTSLENGDVNCVGGFAASADKVTITNSYNYGSVSSPDGTRKDDFVTSINDGSTVTNSFFISECDFEGNGATKMSSTEFADGTVFAALRSGEDGEVWYQYSGDVYPTFVEKNGTNAPSPMHVAVLHYSETDSVAIAYTEGTALTLPTTLPDGSIVVGWYKSDDLSGDAYTKIAATENGDLNFYAKAMKLDSDGYYEIADADMLFKFAELVNTQNSTYGSAKAKLTADIVVNENVLTDEQGNSKVNSDGSYNGTAPVNVWTPIGTSSTSAFKGAFNGQGHTISGLYFNNPETDNVGLFGYTSGAVTIDNVGLVDSYFRGGQNVGSIVAEGTKELTVTRSYNKGAVTGTGNVGGLVGMNGNVQFSYNTGSVTGTSNVGGLVGSNIVNYKNNFEINGSYNVGLVKMGDGMGNAVLGEGCPTGSQTSAVRNVYYLGGSGDECSGAFSMTSYEFADGFVAITLHDDRTVTGADIWGQVVGTDKTPVLTGEIVFPITLDNSDNCYEISNADDLYIFAAIVNSGFKSDACGKLTENIVVNENVLTSAGELNTAPVGGFKEWTPIGLEKNSFDQDISFRGTFHGQGHTISGLYFNDTGAEDVGLFGDVSGTVTIDGVGLVDSYINARGWVGGLVGYARGSLTISNSYNASSVTSDNTFGGLVGAAGKGSSLAISNSYNVGSLNGGGYGGGLVGYANALVVSNSYNAGAIYNSDEKKALVGGITSSVDDASTVTNSFNYGTISYPSNIEVVVDDLVAEGGKGEVTVTNSFTIGESRFDGDGATVKSAAEFADGTVLVALRSGEGGYVWVQAEGDKYPTIDVNASTNAKTIVLDWTSADYSTTLADAGYTDGAMVIVKSGKKFYADGAIYEGILSADQVAAIGGNKLYPISGVELETVNDKLVATLNGDSDESLLIPTDVQVDTVVYKRNVMANTFTTVMLPFSVPATSVENHSFYKFKRVADDPDYTYAVKVSSVTGMLKANQPYIMIDSKGSTQIKFNVSGEKLVLNTTAESYDASSTYGGITWTMRGMFKYKQWLEGDSELGHAYGFAAQEQNGSRIGQFVKLGKGASIVPMRMYLTLDPLPTPKGAPGRPAGYGFSSIASTPEFIGIDIEDDDEVEDDEEETMVVNNITVVPMVIKSDCWFDMKGRVLGQKPTAKGAYYHNGKKVIIK